MPTGIRFVPNDAGIWSLFYDYDGPVQTYLARVTEEVARLAAVEAPRGKTVTAWDGSIAHEGGTLAKSIRAVRLPGGRHAAIALAPYAAAVHQGHGSYQVRPRNRTYLRFEPESGEVVYTRKPVTIPATAPNPFLLNALRRVIT